MPKLYEIVASKIADQIQQRLYAPGERLPGVRKLSDLHKVSITTILQAHQILEQAGHIEPKTRSGYYVRQPLASIPLPDEVAQVLRRPTAVSGQALSLTLAQASNYADYLQLGAAVPDKFFLPTKALNRELIATIRENAGKGSDYLFPPGSVALRRQIARRMEYAGCSTKPDDIIITNGCQEAITLALRAVAKTGDVIAIESPTFYGLLQAIDALGMRAIEIPTHPQHGISLDALTLAIEKWKVKACAIVSNYSNPLGHSLSDKKKKALVALLSRHSIYLIEDDIYGDLGFAAQRLIAAKAYDKTGLVLYCSSFSKSLSPGMRVGWIVPGKQYDEVAYLKFVSNLATPTFEQLALAKYLATGKYDKHLRALRLQLKRNVDRMRQAIAHYFPAGTRVSQPQGGFVVWVELANNIDSVQLYEQALDEKISVAPGIIFSATQKYRNCLRINCAHPWNDKLENALRKLASLINRLGKN